jgi:hypothetical protein
MSGVFINIDPPPTPSQPGECVPPAFGGGGGEDTLAGWRGGGGSIVRKTPVQYVQYMHVQPHIYESAS